MKPEIWQCKFLMRQYNSEAATDTIISELKKILCEATFKLSKILVKHF